MNEPRYTLTPGENTDGGWLMKDGELYGIIPGLDKARALVATLNAAEQMREALEESGKMVQRLANGGKFSSGLMIDGVIKSPRKWAQESVDKTLAALLAAKGVQP